MRGLAISIASAALEIEQVKDLRRSVLCGELHWPRDVVDDPADQGALLLLGSLGPKPVASLRLLKREGAWNIELLAVLGTLRHQGLGRSMLAAAEAAALGQGAESLRVSVTPEYAPFFEKMDFAPVAEHDGISVLEKKLVSFS